jgi:glycosyltransferase involved in cell wall biosynthesis
MSDEMLPEKSSRAMPLTGVSVELVSRCAWTLFNFRRSLASTLTSQGANVRAVGDGRDGFASRLRDSAIAFDHVNISRRGMSPLADVWLLVRFLFMFRAKRPHIVHCFTIKPAIYGTLAAWLARVPVRVVTITGLGHTFTSAPRWLRAAVEIMYRTALSVAHVVQFQNAEDRELFVRRHLVARHKTMIVPGSGINLQRFVPVPLPSIEQGRPVRFLMIARLIREKGVSEYIEAARRVREDGGEVEFALLGGEDPRNPSGYSAQELEQIRSSRVVKWLGETDDVRPHIEAADVVVLPSYREGLPRVLVEAAAMGRPALACDAPGCRDAVLDGVTGYLVPPRDAGGLAAAMRKFAADPDRLATMGAAARTRAVALYDEGNVIGPTLEQYRRLLAENMNDADTAAPT